MRFCLESKLGLKTFEALNFQTAVDILLEEETIHLVVVTAQADADKFFKYLLSTNSVVPVVLITEALDAKIDAYPDIQILGRVPKGEVPDKLPLLVQDNFAQILSASDNEEYCRIHAELLVRVVPLRGNIYVRLSSVKFVKLFRTGMVFTRDDLERTLTKKKISYLYIKKSEAQEFVNKFKSDLSTRVAEAVAGDETLFTTAGEVQDLIQELSSRLGFTKEVQELVQTNIQLTLKTIGASPKVSKALSSSQMNGRNYISSHSVMLANLSCSIAAGMEWPSNTTYQKLVMASLFHDFTFAEPELARISTKKELDGLKLKHSDEKYLTIKNHPAKCAEIVKTFHEIPGDVDVIVLQHHERPDGTGFPKGLRSHQIAPLSAVFIIAHDIVDALERDGDLFDLKRFLKKVEPDYQGTAFRKVWKALMAAETDRAPAEGAA